MLAKIEVKSRLVIDSMEDRAMLAYNAFPERLYVVLDGRVVFRGGFGPVMYSLQDVREFLQLVLAFTHARDEANCRNDSQSMQEAEDGRVKCVKYMLPDYPYFGSTACGNPLKFRHYLN